MTPNLLIFIDGLQYDEAIKKLDILKNTLSSRVMPGMGFSNNIYPEMLCGQKPDEIGYFNEWSPTSDYRPSLFERLLAPLDIFRKATYINAGIRILVLRKLLGKNYANIPFKYIGYFHPQGSHKFCDLGRKSLLNRFDFKIIDSVDYKRSRQKLSSRDIRAIKQASTENFRSKNIFLSLVELDNISHNCGMGSGLYNAHLDFLNSSLEGIIKRFKSENPVCNIFLFSDHGMAPVNTSFHLELESVLGKMHPQKYLYFLDSTLLRIWIKDSSLTHSIVSFLNTISCGETVSQACRKEFGIEDKKFADIIFRVNEGVIFVPNFFGGRMVKAMHGYDSKIKSQHAVFSEIHSSENNDQLPGSSHEIFEFLLNKFKS